VEPTRWAGVAREGRELFTANAEPGVRVYGEELRTSGGTEYRLWDPFRSKLAAFLLRDPPADVLPPPRTALYLGGAHGTTVSHLADLWPHATIVVVEKSPSSFVALLGLGRRRTNVVPVLADAQLPERYRADVGEVEFLYQDVAQRDQVGIFLENADAVLARGGRGILMLKIRSVTQRASAGSIVRDARERLGRAGFRVTAEEPLTPFAREHVALAVRR
jgi:fibrillarin-like pre-rRNA processing protein